MTPPPARRGAPPPPARRPTQASAPPPASKPSSAGSPGTSRRPHPALGARHPEAVAELGNPARTTLWICAVVAKALKAAGVTPIPYWKDGQPWADKTPDQALDHARRWVTVNLDWPSPAVLTQQARLARRRGSAPPALRASSPSSEAPS